MRGEDHRQQSVFSYVSLDERVPGEHPLRPVRKIVDEIFRGMSKQFDELYSATGRPSIAPERLLRALLLQILYSVRSERMLMEQLDYNLLFRWFVGLEMDEPIWNDAVFSKNRDRLLNQELARVFFYRVLREAQGHLSDDHFTIDGTMIEACASQKSFQKKGGDDDEGGEFRGQKRTNDTHQSKTDPEAKLYRKGNGQEAKLSYLGHVMIENRNGMIVDALVTQADGTAEREAALILTHHQCQRNRKRCRRGTREFVRLMRDMNARPHVTQNVRRRGGSAIDRRTTRHASYEKSQQKRPLIEKAFGWMKQ